MKFPVPCAGLSWMKSLSFSPYHFALNYWYERGEVILPFVQTSLPEGGWGKVGRGPGAFKVQVVFFPGACFEESPEISMQTCLWKRAHQKEFLLASMAQSWGDLPWLLLFLLLAHDTAVSASCKEVRWHTAFIYGFCLCNQQGARAGKSVMGPVCLMELGCCTTAQQIHNVAPSCWVSCWQGTKGDEWNGLEVL